MRGTTGVRRQYARSRRWHRSVVTVYLSLRSDMAERYTCYVRRRAVCVGAAITNRPDRRLCPGHPELTRSALR
jgi:hypothetical protein